MSTRINIVSLGAGFDTLFFRLLAQRQFTGSISFTEVDCNAIVDAKKVLLNDKQVRAQLFQKYANDLTVAESMEDNVAWQCHVSCATYSLIACDLGDIQRLNSSFKTAGVDRNLPTLILAECVLSYLAPEKGTELLQWLAATFPSGSIAVYDPIALQGGSEKNNEQSDRETIEGSDAFSSTLQRYFAVKGCSLRGATGYRTAADHARRFLAFAHWHNCRILDMNSVFAACTSVEEKRRIASLEPFDEYADWVLCNAHYAIYLADNNKRLSENDGEWTSQFVSRAYQHRYLLTSTCVLQQQESQPVIIRTFQNEDLAAVRSLFENTHLEFARNSRAVREFVVKRLRGPVGDMYDVHRAFQIPASTGISNSGFWVAELSGAIVGCVGLKPIAGDQRAAELCRLSVSSAVRRRGVASALVKYAEAFAVSCGAFDEICLDTIGTMEGAQHLYRSLGYIEQLQSKMQYSSFKLLRFRKTL